ncbi:c-type cytochrome [Defluviimonas sp. WL0002]|uniref:C-type cytochrome n=1 Tax=Albidovulum marisflavi TaxID=2984159 RepID=A0ABT2Z9E4_9RHOB|nr:c-type cytochrome [Defluviimonas sp. WL0002]MCV2867640.1 c-type cytochrome [Defluviimonas sp. WL0002]
MFDTMTVTKAGGALCGALLVFLLGNWAAESLYHTGPEAHAGEEVAQAYSIDTGASEGGEAAAEEGPSFEELLASADAGAGEKVFGKCKACHKLDGSNGTGPHLDGVVGRAVGGVAGFSYSDAMAGHGGNWEPAELDHFLANPKGAVPGTKMSFAGLPKAQDRADLIAYLQSVGS